MAQDVRLRDVGLDDLEVFHQQENDPEAVRRSGYPPRDRDTFMNHWKTKVLGDPTVLVRAVEVDGELSGNVVSWTLGERRLMGYWLGRAFWGRGIGTAAVGQFLEQERTRPLYAEVHQGNTASVKLVLRLGFEQVATDEDHLVFTLREPA
jgi:RimJ/RimL family protein N-acetyltransferase